VLYVFFMREYEIRRPIKKGALDGRKEGALNLSLSQKKRTGAPEIKKVYARGRNTEKSWWEKSIPFFFRGRTSRTILAAAKADVSHGHCWGERGVAWSKRASSASAVGVKVGGGNLSHVGQGKKIWLD